MCTEPVCGWTNLFAVNEVAVSHRKSDKAKPCGAPECSYSPPTWRAWWLLVYMDVGLMSQKWKGKKKRECRQCHCIHSELHCLKSFPGGFGNGWGQTVWLTFLALLSFSLLWCRGRVQAAREQAIELSATHIFKQIAADFGLFGMVTVYKQPGQLSIRSRHPGGCCQTARPDMAQSCSSALSSASSSNPRQGTGHIKDAALWASAAVFQELLHSAGLTCASVSPSRLQFWRKDIQQLYEMAPP